MPTLAPFDQLCGETVRVDVWEPDDEFPYLPLGQKPKRVLICPTPAPHRYLIAGHRYLFKEPKGHSIQQIWTEVISYKLARTLAVEVPPAFVGYDGRLGSCGVLIEFFFGHGERHDARFIHARDRFQALRMKLDEKRGSLVDNIVLSRLHRVSDARSWWAQAVAFDTLIGNTDRHSENWGFLVQHPHVGYPSYELAPAFDNGSSLGYVVREDDLPKFLSPGRLRGFVENGRHHYGWVSWDQESGRHVNLCGALLKRHDFTRPTVARVAAISDSQIELVIQSCTEFDFPVPFTERRAAFVFAQIKARRAALERLLGG